MSEFECRNGHLVDPPYYQCQECGGTVVRMDGYSRKQLEDQSKQCSRMRLADMLECDEYDCID